MKNPDTRRIASTLSIAFGAAWVTALIAPAAFAQQNIERVEVLKDGASAIYGSDAIGGVINFILRKDYKGGEATAYANYTQHPGGRGWGTNALVGWGDIAKDSFNATMSFDYRKQDALYGR